MPRPLSPSQQSIGSSPEGALAGGEHVQSEQLRRAISAYRAADDLGGVPSDAVQQKGNTALRVEGYVWLAFCLGMALCALLIAIYEAAWGWWGEASISVLLALIFTKLAHRVLTEINHRHGRLQ